MYDIGQSKYIKEFLHDPAFLPLDVSVVYLFGKPENIINMYIDTYYLKLKYGQCYCESLCTGLI
jgi:hypothetical protein